MSLPDPALAGFGQNQQHFAAGAAAVGPARRGESAVFGWVLVITDRNVRDAQLQEAIRQIDKTPGVIAHIDGSGESKPQLLADALPGGTKIIIIVTNPTFPNALNLIQSQASDP